MGGDDHHAPAPEEEGASPTGGGNGGPDGGQTGEEGTPAEILVGRGGNGRVVSRDGRRTVVKEIETAHPSHTVQTEFVLLDRARHPNVIAALDAWYSGGRVFVKMAYGGPSLRACLPLADVRDAYAQVAAGVTFLHSRGIFHGDLKMDNMVRCPESGRVRLIDFGHAGVLSVGETVHAHRPKGTPRYMAPEVLQCIPYDPYLADAWSLAVTLYELRLQQPLFARADSSDGRFRLLRNRTHLPPWKALRDIVARRPEVDAAGREAWFVEALEQGLCVEPKQRVPLRSRAPVAAADDGVGHDAAVKRRAAGHGDELDDGAAAEGRSESKTARLS